MKSIFTKKKRKQKFLEIQEILQGIKWIDVFFHPENILETSGLPHKTAKGKKYPDPTVRQTQRKMCFHSAVKQSYIP